MQTKWIAMSALALIPCAALAQSNAPKDSAAMSRKTTVTTSTGDVSGPGDVTQAMLDAQKNANMIGTPAWWASHGTADGKPVSALPKH